MQLNASVVEVKVQEQVVQIRRESFVITALTAVRQITQPSSVIPK